MLSIRFAYNRWYATHPSPRRTGVDRERPQGAGGRARSDAHQLSAHRTRSPCIATHERGSGRTTCEPRSTRRPQPSGDGQGGPQNPRCLVIVIETSAVVNALVGDPANPRLLAALADEELHAPALLDFEVASALRGHVLAGKLDSLRLDEA